MKPSALHFCLKILVFLTGYFYPFSLFAQEKRLFPLFQTDEMLSISLAFNMDSLLADRGADPHYHPAQLVLHDEDNPLNLDLKIKARGNFRLNADNCDFPPIRLNFKKSDIEQNIFQGHEKLKLVTHCRDDKYVLREYLAYKIYQLLNPHSFQVRLARITYVDAAGKHKAFTRYAFLLESKEALALRLCGEVVEDAGIRISEEETLEECTAQLYVFQYLLGNRDWDISLQKNIKLVKTVEGEMIPIPYDFDFTAWVNADYTLAFMGDLGRKFEYRAGRKICKPQAVWEKCFAHFESKKTEILQFIVDFEQLSRRDKNELIALVESFYEDIKKPQKAVELFGECK